MLSLKTRKKKVRMKIVVGVQGQEGRWERRARVECLATFSVSRVSRCQPGYTRFEEPSKLLQYTGTTRLLVFEAETTLVRVVALCKDCVSACDRAFAPRQERTALQHVRGFVAGLG